MNLSKHDPETDMDMNMTPMIDVVFLLIIFFMIITDLTQQDLEDLQLPLAKHAVPDQPDPKEWRPVINVKHTGEMIIKRETYYDPEQSGTDYGQLRQWLSFAAERMEKAPLQEGSSTMVPDEPLLIRADESTAFKFVQKIMENCGDQSISIWKIQLAVATPEENQETD